MTARLGRLLCKWLPSPGEKIASSRRKRERMPTRSSASPTLVSLFFYFPSCFPPVCLLLLTEHDQLEYQMARPLVLWWILRNDYNHVRFAENETPPLDPVSLQFEPASSFVACVQIETFPKASLSLSLSFIALFRVFPRREESSRPASDVSKI